MCRCRSTDLASCSTTIPELTHTEHPDQSRSLKSGNQKLVILSTHVDMDLFSTCDTPTTTHFRGTSRLQGSETQTAVPTVLLRLQPCRLPPRHSQNHSCQCCCSHNHQLRCRQTSSGMQRTLVSFSSLAEHTHDQFDDAYVTLGVKMQKTDIHPMPCRYILNDESS